MESRPSNRTSRFTQEVKELRPWFGTFGADFVSLPDLYSRFTFPSYGITDPVAVIETPLMIDLSLLRGDSPDLIEQRLRRDRASEELFQQRQRVEFFAKAK